MVLEINKSGDCVVFFFFLFFHFLFFFLGGGIPPRRAELANTVRVERDDDRP